MKKIILLLLITTSLFSQQRDLPVLDLSRDIIGNPPSFTTTQSSLGIEAANKTCITINWNVVLDRSIQSAQNRVDHILSTVDAVVEFYKGQNYYLIPTINYLSYDIDYIETKEELDELINLSYEEVLDKVKSENKDIKIENYLEL